MKKQLLFLFCVANLSVSSLFSSAAVASDYPPGYVVQTECQVNGPFKVCALNRTVGGYPRILIKYEGMLLGPMMGNFTVLARSKDSGRTLKIPLTYRFAAANITTVIAPVEAYHCITRPYGTAADVRLPIRPSSEQYCQRRTSLQPGLESLVWEVNPISKEETDFVSDIFARPLGNLELSAYDENGLWDSNNGANYSF